MAAERLRAAADAAGGSTQLFSRKVADYVAARPDFPADALDIGAGTGLFARESPAGTAVLRELQALMREHADTQGQVCLRYGTVACLGCVA